MHKTLLSVIITIIICSLTFTGCTNTLTDNKLTVGVSGQMPPYSFYHPETNDLSGYDIDMAHEIADRLDMPLEIQLFEYNRLIPAVLNKQIDCGLGSMNIVKERQEVVDFTIPYNISTGKFLVKKSLKDINSVEDIKKSGILVGVRNGTVYPKILKDKYGFTNKQLKIFPSQRDLSIAIQKKIVDIAISDYGAMYHLNKQTDIDVKFIPEKITEADAGITVNKTNPEFKQKLNNAIKAIIKDGTHAKLSKKWFGENYTPLRPIKD